MVSRASGGLLALAIWTATGALAENAHSIDQLRKEAKKGDVTAQCKLGLAYADAYRVKRDYGLAVEWLQKAALQGHPKRSSSWGRCTTRA